jgi:hypothetical protein
MFENDNFLASTIRNIILSHFIYADIDIIYDKEQNEYYISTRNRDLYYSEAYGLLILDIKQNILWKQGKFNFYFILDIRGREFVTITEKIIFSHTDEIKYKTWDINKTPLFVDSHIDIYNFPLAA